MSSLPAFAVVGAVNHGKSSVAATLAESDAVGISDFPGETIVCQRFVCRNLFELWDTPGFQNPREMLRMIEREARNANDPLAIFRAFATRETGPDFAAECELLRPLLAGAAILYVVDTSQPLEPLHEAEMEILRLTGQPRLAVLNPTREPWHDGVWRARLGQQFGAVHEFNAHRASAHDRAELLRAMSTLSAEWKRPLRDAAGALETDWQRQLHDAATILIELLDEALTHSERGFLPRNEAEKKQALVAETTQRFYREVAAREAKAHQRLIQLFRHGLVEMRTDERSFFAEELFCEETWKVFGLPWWALAVLGAGTGGFLGLKAGALGEAAAPSGIPATIGAMVGAGVGAVGAVFGGQKLAQPTVRFSPGEKTLGERAQDTAVSAANQALGIGTAVAVGPLKGENFPYILLDRALGLFCYLNSRTHARRDQVSLEAARLKEALDRAGASASKWPAELAAACKQHVKALRRAKNTEETRPVFLHLLSQHLAATARKPFVYEPR
jgi:hypothetical protein